MFNNNTAATNTIHPETEITENELRDAVFHKKMTEVRAWTIYQVRFFKISNDLNSIIGYFKMVSTLIVGGKG